MELTLEVVTVPVTDLDRSKKFYEEGCGFRLDLDQEVAPGVRIVQLTPPGSRCSIALMGGFPLAPGQRSMAPGALQGLQLCVTDLAAARAALVERAVDISEIQHVGESGWEGGPGGVWNSFAFFRDPDGNGWAIQEAPSPLSDR
ncbi:VOC family protein [Streptomyces sp. NBC_00690]|uniref:VOC family protein n=1 Tax=Streptomyces sp. NBC_00690 TaxID=2975808 RepID=UPI002E2A20B9|nr:VOC family protein [Streptomyces sp. NBC_00690]